MVSPATTSSWSVKPQFPKLHKTGAQRTGVFGHGDAPGNELIDKGFKKCGERRNLLNYFRPSNSQVHSHRLTEGGDSVWPPCPADMSHHVLRAVSISRNPLIPRAPMYWDKGRDAELPMSMSHSRSAVPRGTCSPPSLSCCSWCSRFRRDKPDSSSRPDQ